MRNFIKLCVYGIGFYELFRYRSIELMTTRYCNDILN